MGLGDGSWVTVVPVPCKHEEQSSNPQHPRKSGMAAYAWNPSPGIEGRQGGHTRLSGDCWPAA